MRPVIIPEYVGVFQKLAACDALLKLGPGDEMVTLARALVSARRSRGVGNRELKGRHFRQQPRHEGGFARPRWRRDDENGGQRATPDLTIAPEFCRFLILRRA